MSGSEKRRYTRVPVKVEFSVRDGSAEEMGELYFSSKNVSVGGAFLVSDFLMEKGTDIRVRFQLPGETLVEASARVAWVSDGDEDDTAGMGIEFTVLTPDIVRSIRRFMQRSTATT